MRGKEKEGKERSVLGRTVVSMREVSLRLEFEPGGSQAAWRWQELACRLHSLLLG
jgi:hypothetical protein